jgi:MFS family permease
VLTGYFQAPESPRWLASKGRIEEVRAFLVKYHADGDENSPLVTFELEEITATLALETRVKQTTSYADMLRTKGNRHRLLISLTLGIFSQWNGVGIAGYYLSPVLKTVGVTSVTEQTMISGFLQVWNLILAVSAAFSVDRLGRRKLFLASSLGMLGSYIFITAFSATFAHTLKAATGAAVIPFLFLFYGFYDIAFTPLLVSYTCEIWPYEFRARGVAVMFMSTNVAVFFNIFINPIALESIQWKYYLVYCIILVFITTAIYYLYPETNGHTLETMARVFDGEDALVPEEGRVKEAVVGRVGSASHDAKKMRISHEEI